MAIEDDDADRTLVGRLFEVNILEEVHAKAVTSFLMTLLIFQFVSVDIDAVGLV